MSDTSISAQIIGRCTPAFSVDASRVDGMTLVNIEPTKPSQLDTIYRDSANSLWRIIGNLLEADFRGKACQANVNGFADWLKASGKTLPESKKVGLVQNLKTGFYDVRPFVLMEVENPINNQYWSFTGGTAAGDGELTPNLAATFGYKGVVASQKGIPGDVRWFGPRTTVTISGKDAGTSAHVIASYQVKDAAVIGNDLVIYLDNIGSNIDDPIYNYDDNHVKRANVSRGVITRGLPNVTTGEAYCDNIPGLNTKQFKPFWLQSTRRSIKVDSEYLKYVSMIRDNNPLFRQFGDVDSVTYNKQVQMDYDNRLVETFLHNPALVNQTQEKYVNLDKVQFFVGDSNSSTFSWEGRYQMRRANAVGYLEQLAECTDEDDLPMLVDLLGAKIDLAQIHRKIYLAARVRRARGMDAKVFELWMTSDFREKMVDAYTLYFKNKGQSIVQLTMPLNSNSIGFTWKSINVDWPNVELRLVSHQALDDYVAAHKKAALDAADNEATAEIYKKLGNLMLSPDWSATYRATLETGKQIMETGTPQEIVKVDAALLCGPLTAPSQRVDHYWEVFTQVVECATTQPAWENFDNTGVDQT